MFFSDAVFAIAMTLLVLDLKVPQLPGDASVAAVQEALLNQLPSFAAFALSFVLVGTTWINHHRRFQAIVAYNGTLQRLNLLVLFFVAFLPVPTALLFLPGAQSPWPPVLYALTIAGTFLSLNALWRYAWRAKLTSGVVDGPLYRLVLGGTMPVWAVFLLSVPVAFADPVTAMYAWILVWPLSWVHGRFAYRRFAAAEAAALRSRDDGGTRAAAAG